MLFAGIRRGLGGGDICHNVQAPPQGLLKAFVRADLTNAPGSPGVEPPGWPLIPALGEDLCFPAALFASFIQLKGQMNQNFDFSSFLPNLLINSQINIF